MIFTGGSKNNEGFEIYSSDLNTHFSSEVDDNMRMCTIELLAIYTGLCMGPEHTFITLD